MHEHLTRQLGYSFNNPALLKMALTHRSSEDENNERLEFLGDAIVNLIIAEALFKKFPMASEGNLSRFRANLINRDTLGELARQFDIGRDLYLGAGELKSGGGKRSSILSCALEAIIGAIYCDSNYEVTRDCVLKWYQPLLEHLTLAIDAKDPKTQLQEYLQSQHLPLPIYAVESTTGQSHEQFFVVSCRIKGFAATTKGHGMNRRRAEQDAATQMLEILKS